MDISNIIGVVPARSGSKRLPSKNIKLLAGKPLIFHTIDFLLEVGVPKVIFTSDSQKYFNLVEKQYFPENEHDLNS